MEKQRRIQSYTVTFHPECYAKVHNRIEKLENPDAITEEVKLQIMKECLCNSCFGMVMAVMNEWRIK